MVDHFGSADRKASISAARDPLADFDSPSCANAIRGAPPGAQAKLTARRVRVITNPAEVKVDDREPGRPRHSSHVQRFCVKKKGRPPEATALMTDITPK